MTAPAGRRPCARRPGPSLRDSSSLCNRRRDSVRVRAVRLRAHSSVTLAVLFLLWQDARAPRDAAWLGFAFGFALFGSGVSWVYIALNTFGGMPLALAALGHGGLLRVSRALPGRRGMARDTLDGTAHMAARVRGGGGVDAHRMAAQLALPGSAGCRSAIRSCPAAARRSGYAPGRRRVRGDARRSP